MFGEGTNFDIIPGPNHGVNLFLMLPVSFTKIFIHLKEKKFSKTEIPTKKKCGEHVKILFFQVLFFLEWGGGL